MAGTIALSDAVALVGARAAVVDRLTGRYAMAVLGVGVDEAESVIAEAPGWLEVSAVNGPSSTVVSGDHDAVRRRRTETGPATGHRSPTSCPSTTRATPARCGRCAAELAELLPDSAFQDGPVTFVGSTFGAEVGSDADFSPLLV